MKFLACASKKLFGEVLIFVDVNLKDIAYWFAWKKKSSMKRINYLMLGGNKKVTHTSAAGLFKYVWPFCYHQIIKVLTTDYLEVTAFQNWIRKSESKYECFALHDLIKFAQFKNREKHL